MPPHPVGRAEWDADVVRDDVRGYVAEHPYDGQPVVADETGERIRADRGGVLGSGGSAARSAAGTVSHGPFQ